MGMVLIAIAFVCGRYHVLWTDSSWVLLPILTIPILFVIDAAMREGK